MQATVQVIILYQVRSHVTSCTVFSSNEAETYPEIITIDLIIIFYYNMLSLLRMSNANYIRRLDVGYVPCQIIDALQGTQWEKLPTINSKLQDHVQQKRSKIITMCVRKEDIEHQNLQKEGVDLGSLFCNIIKNHFATAVKEGKKSGERHLYKYRGHW